MIISEKVAFNQSYVLGISITPYVVSIKMDFMLMDGHPLYGISEDSGVGHFLRGEIIVDNFRRIEWESAGSPPAIDANDEVDFGCMDDLIETAEGYSFSGDWGTLRVLGGNGSVKMYEAP